MSAQRSAPLATYARFASLGSEGKHGVASIAPVRGTQKQTSRLAPIEKRRMVCMTDVPATRESAQMSPFRRSPVARKGIFVNPLRAAPGRILPDDAERPNSQTAHRAEDRSRPVSAARSGLVQLRRQLPKVQRPFGRVL